MADDQAGPAGPDLTQGIALAELDDGGKLLGHVGEEPVLLVRRGADIFAIGALCTHYHGPLADGLVVGDTVRCPWHHACFDLRTGEALHAPAFDPVDCWQVEQRDGKIFVREKRARTRAQRRATRGRAEQDRDRRRRRGRVRRRGDASAARLSGRNRHAEQRRFPAGRPAEPVQGLSRRQRPGGVGAAPRRQLLCRERHRPSPRRDRRRHRRRLARSLARRRRENSIRSASAGDRRRAGAPVDSGREAVRRARAALAQRLPGDHRAREGGAAGGRARRELHRPRSRGRLARKEHRSSCRCAGGASDGARSRARNGRVHPRAARGAWRRVPSAKHGERDRRRQGETIGRKRP